MRKEYASPRRQVYGDIRVLTLGGEPSGDQDSILKVFGNSGEEEGLS